MALTAAAALLAGALVTACGGDKDEQTAAAKNEAATTAAAVPPANADEKHDRLAVAVVDSKTTAPVDMHYDLLAKPELGQPFEVEMTFSARLPADKLEVSITEAPGLTIVGEQTAAFAPVERGQSYASKVLVKGDNPGLYYVGVIARMSTKVQTETRAFAIPVVIGDPPSAQKANPAKDSTGQAVQSVPAQEPK
ncbi:MAG: hypothetical protein IPJ97_12890 [Proteobacteria bacterium]|nr:hypothetical protein [Pseudomonadota bacterium]